MFRVKLGLIIVGGVVAFMGGQEFLVSHGTTTEAVNVDLAKLEAGEELENNHARIGEHTAIYAGSVYAYETSKYDNSTPRNSTKVSYCFYPILSSSHSFMQRLVELEEEYGSLEEVPENVEFPEIKDFTVLVKTKSFKTVGSIPDGIADRPSIQGLVINQIDSLDSEEEELLLSSFPGLDMDKVLILEDGRTPASLGKSLGMTLGGGLISLLGLGWLVVGHKEK